MSKTGLIDTNILIYAIDESSFYHNSAHLFLEKIVAKETIFLTLQNFTEFYAIVTNPKRVNTPLTQNEAVKTIVQFIQLNLFHIIIPKQKTLETIINLLLKYRIRPSEIHDVHLAAVMLDNHIRTIYTADTSVFIKLGLNAVNPLQ